MHGNSKFDRKTADEILRRLAEGETLRAVCRDDEMPPESTVRRWALDDVDGFSAQYARAREIGYHSMADEILEISDDGTNDWMRRNGQDQEVSWQANGEHIQRSRLRVDSRKWLVSKALPKVYGDKVINEHSGPDGGPIETSDVSPVEKLTHFLNAKSSRSTRTDE